jgi:hypothetical protein
VPQTALNKDCDLSFQAFKDRGITISQEKKWSFEAFDKEPKAPIKASLRRVSSGTRFIESMPGSFSGDILLMAAFLALHLELPERYPSKPGENLIRLPMPCLPDKFGVIPTCCANKRPACALHADRFLS